MSEELNKAAQQALDVLEHGVAWKEGGLQKARAASAALRHALNQRPAAQTEQGAFETADDWLKATGRTEQAGCTAAQLNLLRIGFNAARAILALRPQASATAAEQVEPRAYLICGGRLYKDQVVMGLPQAEDRVATRGDGSRIEPLYTRALRPQAAPMTDEQAKQFLKRSALLDMFLHIGWYSAPRKGFDEHALSLIRAIEAHHGITAPAGGEKQA